MIDQETIKSILDYNPATGIFVWKERPDTDRYVRAWNCRYAGKEVTSTNGHGYTQVSIKINGIKKRYEAHRLAWLYMYGYLPFQVDHENRNKLDNRITNLRESDYVKNGHNVATSKRNTSGVKGIYWHKGAQKWCSRITFNKENKYLGLFNSLEEAANAYKLESINKAKEFSIHAN